MAILAPADLPSIMKVRSEPMKKYILSKLGYPNVNVEITEDQWEVIWRVAGDFIAAYFPREQRLGMFYTVPLKPTYPLPKDAYWVQSVHWDPITTRIDDVFGAESFLFCLSNDFMVLDKFESLQPLGDWKKHWKAKTPYGDSKLSIVKHKNVRSLPKIRITYDGGVVEATNNHVLLVDDKWLEFGEVSINQMVSGIKDKFNIQNIEHFDSVDAIGVRANDSGCYYGCINGNPILIH